MPPPHWVLLVLTPQKKKMRYTNYCSERGCHFVYGNCMHIMLPATQWTISSACKLKKNYILTFCDQCKSDFFAKKKKKTLVCSPKMSLLRVKLCKAGRRVSATIQRQHSDEPSHAYGGITRNNLFKLYGLSLLFSRYVPVATFPLHAFVE